MVEALVPLGADPGGAQFRQAGGFGVDLTAAGFQRQVAAAAGVNVDVQAVLDGLAFGDPLEPDAGAAAVRVDDAIIADPRSSSGRPTLRQ